MDAALFGAALALAPGVGRVRYRELLDRHLRHEAAFAEAVAEWERGLLLDAARALLDSARAVGASAVAYGSPDYPSRLRELSDPPPLLFVRGAREWMETGPAVAIVGTRAATGYGERVTREIAGQLARAGALVISGLARGIDAAAHRGALESGGRTAAVLGTGIDIAYPAAHRSLHAEIGARGLLLTEQPPGEKASGGSFPERNRIIAALADLVIVVEAPVKSGALITASRALELGRMVAAVPGPIDSPQSAGSNELLRDGAQCIASAADALALVGLTAPPRAPSREVDGPDRVVWDALGRGALDLDTLASTTALPAREVLAAVTRLELSGAVECALTGEIRRR
ncbi:MAG TPA: DNA-processing protein DprA [Gemmatimonadaceae bacterium]